MDASTDFSKYLGDGVKEVLSGKGKVGMIEGDPQYIGLYFSAHWCPPCRGFTPKLAEFYNEKNKDKKRIEIIFISSDRDQSSFDEYYASMPWLALDYSERDKKAALSQKYNIQGIPNLVILNKDGTVKYTNGRERVVDDKVFDE